METSQSVGLPDRASPVRAALVHRHRLIRDILARLLAESGTVVIAELSEPSPLLRLTQAELALVDAPPGSEAHLRQLRQARPELKLVVLGSDVDEQTVARWRELGAAGYVDKRSSHTRSVVEAVRQVSAGGHYFPQPPGRPRVPEWSGLERLSARELEVLRCVAEGTDNANIARSLAIAEGTVKAHVSSLYRKLGRENRTQLVLLARSLQLAHAARA